MFFILWLSQFNTSVVRLQPGAFFIRDSYSGYLGLRKVTAI